MLKNSFIFLPKISMKKEQLIWQQGIKDWQDFLKAKKIKGISLRSKLFYDKEIKQAQQSLLEDYLLYFKNNFPSNQIWRLYPNFKGNACYLDLEVDSKGKVIVLSISNYYSTNTFIKSVNLYSENIRKELDKYSLLITFNGSSFDLPKLKKQFGVDIKLPHLDLKPLCTKLKLKGGLKEIEKQLNLKRPQHLYGNPVDLWKAFYASGDKDYLNLLIEYNKEDVENLKIIADHTYQKLSSSLFRFS